SGEGAITQDRSADRRNRSPRRFSQSKSLFIRVSPRRRHDAARVPWRQLTQHCKVLRKHASRGQVENSVEDESQDFKNFRNLSKADQGRIWVVEPPFERTSRRRIQLCGSSCGSSRRCCLPRRHPRKSSSVPGKTAL